MKLLLDENLSDRMVKQIVDLYPNSAHVKWMNLDHSDDEAIWLFAAQNQYVIVSKDADFHQRSLVYGHPPKFIFLRMGNCSTQQITDLLRASCDVVEEFGSDNSASILILG